MARMSEARCKEVIRGETSQMLYPYPEYEKPYPLVVLDTTIGDMTLKVSRAPFLHLLSFVS